MADKPKGTVVEAAVSAGASGSQHKGAGLGARIEAAQAQAIHGAYAAAITDPAEHLKLKLAAREQVKAEFKAEQETAAAAAQKEAEKAAPDRK